MNPTQEVIEKLKVLRLDLSEDIGDWSHSIMAIEAALALLQPVATPAPAGDWTNHHNALKCPYCNPKGLKLYDPEG